ncbi:hypothetical protein HCP17_001435 [Salmonella enterica]|nr:hypothetical protein [Salmonella enterica]
MLLAGMGILESRLTSEREHSPTSNTIEGWRGVLFRFRRHMTPTLGAHTAPLQAAWSITEISEVWATTATSEHHAILLTYLLQIVKVNGFSVLPISEGIPD